MKIKIEGVTVEVLEISIVLVNKEVKQIYEQVEAVSGAIMMDNAYARHHSQGPVEMLDSGNIRCPLTICDPSLSC